MMVNVPGVFWGEMGAPLTTVINTFGGEWFDMSWKPQLTSAATEAAVKFYINLVKNYGEPGATSSGFTECETDLSGEQAITRGPSASTRAMATRCC